MHQKVTEKALAGYRLVRALCSSVFCGGFGTPGRRTAKGDSEETEPPL
jgi:hypothetical protein